MAHTYLTSHPWINFNIRFEDLDYYKNWLLLGEARSKCDHIGGTPLLPEIAEKMHQLYMAKGILATTAIEGNTLSLDEVERRIQGKLPMPPSKEYLGQEIDNIVHACISISDAVFARRSIPITPAMIMDFNQMVLERLPLAESVIPGAVRTYNVTVGRYRGAPHEDCTYLIEKLCTWLNEFTIPGLHRTAIGIIKAILSHIYIAWIHPFGDGNGRTARLVEFFILLQSGVPTAAAHLLSNHYNQTRSEYYRHLDISHQQEQDGVSLFIGYALQGFVDGLQEQINYIKHQQRIVHWENYIYAKFRDQDSSVALRQRRLVLDLSKPVDEFPLTPIDQVRYISPRIAEAYAGKTDKTIERDIAALIAMGLITRDKRGIRPNITRIEAFIPPSLSDT